MAGLALTPTSIQAPRETRLRPGERMLLVYWGRRGPFSKIMLELARLGDDRAVLSVSRQNELFESISATGVPLVPIDGYRNGMDAILGAHQLVRIRRDMAAAIERYQIGKVVVLMSHVWTPFLAPLLRRRPVTYAVLVHDAAPHPGDITGLVNRWLLQDALWADEILTLTQHVACQLRRRFPQLAERRIRVLFHPLFESRAARPEPRAGDTQGAGFVFAGRIMAYKGLPLFVEACEILFARGLRFRIGVVGEGPLGAFSPRLQALGAEIVNRWVPHDRLADIVASYDAVVLPSLEASQSGVVPLALGCGLPVITTRLGGLIEQVEDGVWGLLAEPSAGAIAEAMQRVLLDAELRARLRAGVVEAQHRLSLENFFAALCED